MKSWISRCLKQRNVSPIPVLRTDHLSCLLPHADNLSLFLRNLHSLCSWENNAVLLLLVIRDSGRVLPSLLPSPLFLIKTNGYDTSCSKFALQASYFISTACRPVWFSGCPVMFSCRALLIYFAAKHFTSKQK